MEELIEEFVNSMAMGLEIRSKKPSTDVWPSPKADLTLANDYSANSLFDIFNSLCLNYDVTLLATAIEYPSIISYFLYLFFVPPVDKNENNKRLLVLNKLLSVLNILRNNDPFVKNKSNIILPQKDIEYTLSNIKEITQDEEKLVRMILVGLATLNEYNFFAWMGLGREIHGPYKHNDTSYIIYNYHDLLLPHWRYSENLNFSTIRVIIETSDDISFDFNGRLYNSKGIRKDNIKAKIIINNEKLNITHSTLEDIFKNIATVNNFAKKETSIMSGGELLQHHIQNQFYMVNKIAQKLNYHEYFTPSDKLLSSVLSNNKEPSFSNCLKQLENVDDKEERIRILKKSFDPRLY